MAFTRRIFTKEFRLNAAKLVVDEHRPAVDVARELDINPKSLYSWVRQYRSGLLSSAMTFFQGKRNETLPERFTIVS